MTLDELKRLDPKKIGSWPILPKFGVLLGLLLLLVFAAYWFDWQNQMAQIDEARAANQIAAYDGAVEFGSGQTELCLIECVVAHGPLLPLRHLRCAFPAGRFPTWDETSSSDYTRGPHNRQL